MHNKCVHTVIEHVDVDIYVLQFELSNIFF